MELKNNQMRSSLEGQLDVSDAFTWWSEIIFDVEKPQADWQDQKVPEIFWEAWKEAKVQE